MAISLDMLLPELLALIMQATDSPRQLYRLISASPTCFRLFASTPQHFLACTIKNSLAPENISHMAALLHIPKTAPQPERTPQLTLVLDQYFDSSFPFTLSDNKSELMRICRLSTCLSDLLDGFVAKMRYRFGTFDWSMCHPTQRSTDRPPIPTLAPLSSSEKARLQRAFLRFELYCRAFPPDNRDGTLGSYPSQMQSELFLSRLALWEIEEMCCVHQYFSSILGDTIDEMEREIIKAVREAPGVCARGIQTSTGSGYNDDEMCSVGSLMLTDLAMFGEMNRANVSANISFMTSLGLRQLGQLSHVNRQGRMEFIKQNSPRWCTFLPQALRHVRQSDMEQLQPGHDDDPSHANYGYFMLKKSLHHPSVLEITGQFALCAIRELGYVFWDSWRFTHPPMSDKLNKAKNLDSFTSAKLFDRSRRVPIEKRLEGVRLPECEFRRIEEEFGSAVRREERLAFARGQY